MPKLPESGVFPVGGLPEKISLGDVIVFVGSYTKYNHRGGLETKDRVRGLRAWPTGGDGFTYYWAPLGGPVIRLGYDDWRRVREWDYYFGGGRG